MRRLFFFTNAFSISANPWKFWNPPKATPIHLGRNISSDRLTNSYSVPEIYLLFTSWKKIWLNKWYVWVFVCSLQVTHTDTHTYALGATSGASDYAVKPNQFPVFGLMDAIIFTDLKQVSMPPPPSASTQQLLRQTYIYEHNLREDK